MLEWCKSYLSDCCRYVRNLGCQSEQCLIFRGASQGSLYIYILGTLLFLIYINDLNKCTNMKIAHYADDSTVYIMGESLDSLIRKTYFELGVIDNCLRAN